MASHSQLKGEPLPRSFLTPQPQIPTQIRVIKQSLYRLCEAIHITGFNKETCLSVYDNLGNTTCGRCHYRPSGCHSFYNGNPESFKEGWQDEDIHERQ